MSDRSRLAALRRRLDERDGLDADTYYRLQNDLDVSEREFGLDEQGRMKVAMFDSKEYDVSSFTAANRNRFAIEYLDTPLTHHTVGAARDCRAVCIFVNDVADEKVVRALAEQGVELIALRCAGFNNVALDVCKEVGISVARVPAYSPHSVAEFALGLILTLSRNLNRADARVRAGNFSLEGLTGFDMFGKAVGVLGTGKIGQCTVDVLSGLGVEVLAVDAYPNSDLAAREYVTYVEADEMFARADVITLHAPLLPSTHHIIDEAAISKMKRGVMIINTSRGPLIDTSALIEGLKSGHIGAAGLDVYEEEAGVFFSDMSGSVLTDDVLARLLQFPNVVVTSHQAFLTREALGNIAATTMSNLGEFVAGKQGAQLTNAVSG